MRIAIVGPGAMGTLLAALLCQNQSREVWLLDHNRERAAQIAQSGLILEKDERRIPLPIRAASEAADIGPCDLVFLCVKSYQVEAALLAARPLLFEGTLLVALQNGIGHIELLQRQNIPGHWALGVTTMGATLLAPGQVRHGGHGLTRLGFTDDVSTIWQNRLADCVDILVQAGLDAQVSENIMAHIWGKLFVNVGINALTALHDCPNGNLLEDAALRVRMEAAVLEASVVAKGLGVEVLHDPLKATREVCRATAHNISSMLQDVRKKQRTEIAAINGAVVRLAAQLGMPAPVNAELSQKIQALEATYLPVFS